MVSGGLEQEVPLIRNETSLLAAAWRYRWLVTVVTAFVMAVGVLVYLVLPQEVVYRSDATVVIQEPVQSLESGVSQSASTQYIRSQLEIMRSPIVIQNAVDIAGEEGVVISPADYSSAVEITGTLDSPLVSISAEAETPEQAIILANSMADAYRQVTQRQATATSETQLNRIDAQVVAIDERLAEIDVEIRSLISDDPGLQQLRDQASLAVSEIAALQQELLDAPVDDRQPLRDRIEDYRQTIATYNDVITASTGGPSQQALLEEQSLQIDRRARLLALRDEVEVDAGMAPDAIALVQEAVTAEALSGLSLSRVIAVTLVLGLGLGLAAAYFLSTWRRVFTSRSEPEAILGAPLLADVPDFEAEGLTSSLPVWDHPRSAAAEAYRFAAAATQAAARVRDARSVFFASSTLGRGKTTTVVNTAMAATIHGRSVLVMDCDFGNQEASRLLAGDDHARLFGITNIIEGGASVEEGTHRIDLGEGRFVELLPRGTLPALAASTLQSNAASDLFESIVKDYDIVMIDGPPVLQVAYASTLAQLADSVVVVVEHQASQSELADLRERLSLVSTPVLGYVYNRSPLRREMTMTEGSMMDILGDAGFSDGENSARPKRRV